MIDELVNKKIGVICGGFSREREISLRSGQNIYQALSELGYDVDIIDYAQNQSIKEACDIAFIGLHGADGEDGMLQFLLEQQHVPFTGCGTEASLIGFNKYVTKKLFEDSAITIPLFQRLNHTLTSLPKNFSFPIVLKPLNEGSSIDVFIIDDEKELAIKTAYLVQKYAQYLLEEYIEGKEVTVGVINNPDPVVLPALELRPKNRFYDYEAKYTKGLTEFVLPAELTQEENNKLVEDALYIYQKSTCFGMARLDFLVSPTKGPVLLEINTVPGMTDTSDLPAQAKQANISFNTLVEIILKSSLKRLK